MQVSVNTRDGANLAHLLPQSSGCLPRRIASGMASRGRRAPQLAALCLHLALGLAPPPRRCLTRLSSTQSSSTPGWTYGKEAPTSDAWCFARTMGEGREPCDVADETYLRCTAAATYKVTWSRPPRRALVLAKKSMDDAELRVASEVARVIAGLGIDILMAEPLYSRARARLADRGIAAALWESEDDGERRPDFLATIGGDGLLLYANALFQRTAPPPVIAFSAGSLGFLAPFDAYDKNADGGIENAMDLAAGLERDASQPPPPWPVSLRMRLRCTVFDGDSGDVLARHEALNEVVVNRGDSEFLSAVECFCNDEHLTTAQADGIIVATPTGSTAYSLSAGGPMVHPSANAMVFTPVCPHSLSFRPMIFPDSAELKFVVDGDARADAWATFDGRNRVKLKRGDELVVTPSPYPLPTVLRLGNTADWFGGLRTHFNFNVRVRQKPLS